MSESELRNRKGGAVKKTEEPQPVENKERPKTDLELAQEKYRKFFTRSIWGAIMIFSFAGILYSNHYLVCLFVVILQVIVFREMINLRYTEAKEKNLKGFRTVHWWFLFVTFFYVYGSPVLQQVTKFVSFASLDFMLRSHLAISFTLYVVGFIAFIVTLEKDSYRYQFGQLTWTLMTLMLVVGQSNFVIRNILKGLFWMVMPSSLIICNDIMAYFCGMLFGRKFVDKPLTSLSPNKTWEGFTGAFFLTLVWSFFFSGILGQWEWMVCPKVPSDTFLVALQCTPDPVFIPTEYPLPGLIASILSAIGFTGTSITLLPIQFHALFFALFASLIAPFGGFFASGIKRAYRVKDFDSLFPGHGGMTDRMDCQFIMGLFTYVYMSTFIHSASLTATQVMASIQLLSVEEQRQILNQLTQLLS